MRGNCTIIQALVGATVIAGGMAALTPAVQAATQPSIQVTPTPTLMSTPTPTPRPTATSTPMFTLTPTPTATPTPTSTLSPTLTNFFPIGVWLPPVGDFTKWKSRGVNTVVGVPWGTKEADWTAQARTQNMRMIRPPISSPSADITESRFLAWAQPDEPDGTTNQVPYATIQSQYNKWKRIDPNRLVYINLIGDLNQYDTGPSQCKAGYQPTCQSGRTFYQKHIAGADWISGDIYPVNRGLSLSSVSEMVDKLRAWSGTKPVFAFIESADYDTTDATAAITPGQLRAEIWAAIIHGVRGIWYFPERLSSSFVFDATPSNIVTEMTNQNNIVTSLTSVLQGPINPGGISATVASPLETAWRSDTSGNYFFVLNMSNSSLNAQSITLSGVTATTATVYQENRTIPISGGTITDNFGPYAVHIYRVSR